MSYYGFWFLIAALLDTPFSIEILRITAIQAVRLNRYDSLTVTTIKPLTWQNKIAAVAQLVADIFFLSVWVGIKLRGQIGYSLSYLCIIAVLLQDFEEGMTGAACHGGEEEAKCAKQTQYRGFGNWTDGVGRYQGPQHGIAHWKELTVFRTHTTTNPKPPSSTCGRQMLPARNAAMVATSGLVAIGTEVHIWCKEKDVNRIAFAITYLFYVPREAKAIATPKNTRTARDYQIEGGSLGKDPSNSYEAIVH
ncbi:hypothetical protein BC832DRAFT_540886 [Gaertneriomyces semiglobifer]|nr:hypothetical protein BC832DRAFT_540886 [Gaertneriomyces semiglobifer]